MVAAGDSEGVCVGGGGGGVWMGRGVWGEVSRCRLWGLNKTSERIKWKSFCCNHAAVLDLAECCHVKRNYWVAASKWEELQLIAPLLSTPTINSTSAPPQPDQEREAFGCNRMQFKQFFRKGWNCLWKEEILNFNFLYWLAKSSCFGCSLVVFFINFYVLTSDLSCVLWPYLVSGTKIHSVKADSSASFHSWSSKVTPTPPGGRSACEGLTTSGWALLLALPAVCLLRLSARPVAARLF